MFAYTQYYVNVFKEFLRSKSVNFSRIWYRGFKHNEKEIMSGGENYFKGVGSLWIALECGGGSAVLRKE